MPVLPVVSLRSVPPIESVEDEVTLDPDALLGYNEIAEVLGLRAATLRNYRRRGYMPPPDVMLADRPRWRWATVQRWVRDREVGANEQRPV